MGSVFTAFPALVDRLGIERRGIVHVGAHEGQEVPFYETAGFAHDRLTLVEPIPALATALRERYPRARVLACACADEPGEAVLHVMRRTNVSTLVAPHRLDRVTGTIRVPVRTLAGIQEEAPGPPNVAVIDAQGLESAVLRGADLAALDLVIAETCTVPDPTMASPYAEVTELMFAAGFIEVDRWVRDLDWVRRWARGRRQSATGGEIRDVVFAREV